MTPLQRKMPVECLSMAGLEQTDSVKEPWNCSRCVESRKTALPRSTNPAHRELVEGCRAPLAAKHAIVDLYAALLGRRVLHRAYRRTRRTNCDPPIRRSGWLHFEETTDRIGLVGGIFNARRGFRDGAAHQRLEPCKERSSDRWRLGAHFEACAK